MVLDWWDEYCEKRLRENFYLLDVELDLKNQTECRL